MAYSYRIDADRRFVLTRAWGTLASGDIAQHRVRLRADPAFDAEYSQLVDLRAVTEVEATPEEIAFLARDPLFAAGARRAIVAASPAVFGLARMFGTYAESAEQNVHVFADMDKACAWLDLDHREVPTGPLD